MDLIFTDSNKNEQGVLKSYILDIAYGSDENNFKLTCIRTDEQIEDSALIYLENVEDGIPTGTEYGGIIDSITTDTGNNEIIYEGRTWHGILEGSIIEPDEGYDYYEADGDANEVLQNLIDKLDLADIFFVSDEASDIMIEQYQFDRYIDAYKGSRRMLASANAKLKLRYNSSVQKVEMIASIINDYSDDEEWNNELFDFKAKVNYNPVNHIICLGQGELADRAVIHLFLDEDNALQDYSTTDMPLEAEDYILDKSQQKIFGMDEKTEVLDFPSAEVVENYIPLDVKPENWESSCDSYYYMTGSGDDAEYGAVEYEELNYAELTTKPSDWDTSWGKYYQLKGNDYEQVSSITADIYKEITKIPSNWKKNFSGYYKSVDGEFKSIEGIKIYDLLTSKPKDWDLQFRKYFYKTSQGEYKQVEKRSVTYGLLTSKPSDWATRYTEYYTKEGSEYKEVPKALSYSLLTSKPKNWKSKYSEYFTKNGANYEPVKGVTADKYVLLSKRPSDWKSNSSNYYYKDGSSYNQVESSKDKYSVITKKPNKWNSEYNNYYIRTWDGVQMQYSAVGTVTKKTYVKQKSSKAPSDWSTNYSRYFKLGKNGKFESVKGVKSGKKTVAPAWAKNKYYTEYSTNVTPNYNTVAKSSYEGKLAYKTVVDNVPKWKKNAYYVKHSSAPTAPTWNEKMYYSCNAFTPTWTANRYYKALQAVAPTWTVNTYYKEGGTKAPSFDSANTYVHITEVAPVWQKGKYYYEHEWKRAPIFEAGSYFRQALDYYKSLVESGIERFQKYIDADEIEMSNQLYQDYDIGDIVGANDEVTGIAVWQPITKKIVTINKDEITYSYEIGKE